MISRFGKKNHILFPPNIVHNEDNRLCYFTETPLKTDFCFACKAAGLKKNSGKTTILPTADF